MSSRSSSSVSRSAWYRTPVHLAASALLVTGTVWSTGACSSDDPDGKAMAAGQAGAAGGGPAGASGGAGAQSSGASGQGGDAGHPGVGGSASGDGGTGGQPAGAGGEPASECAAFPEHNKFVFTCSHVISPGPGGVCTASCHDDKQTVEASCDPAKQACDCELTNGQTGADRQVFASCSCSTKLTSGACVTSENCCPWASEP